MKRILILVFTVITLNGLNAQPFDEGSQAVNLGVGFGQAIFNGSGYEVRFPAISASYEYGIKEIPMGAHLNGVVSAGAFAGFQGAKYQFPYLPDNSLAYNVFLFSLRGNYHFIFHDKIDTYAGLHFGYAVIGSEWKGPGPMPNEVTPVKSGVRGGGYVGGRYYFNDNLALHAELGWMLYLFSIGVSYRLYR